MRDHQHLHQHAVWPFTADQMQEQAMFLFAEVPRQPTDPEKNTCVTNKMNFVTKVYGCQATFWGGQIMDRTTKLVATLSLTKAKDLSFMTYKGICM